MLLTLQRRADSKNQPAQYSWEAINNILSNVQGNSVDYVSFKGEYDSDPTMKNFIQNFDKDGLTIKTRNKAAETPVGEPDSGNAVDKMAKRAAAKDIKS